MSCDPLIALAFTNSCFHQILQNTFENVPNKQEEISEFINKEFKIFLGKYEEYMSIDDEDEMLEIIESINKINYKKLNVSIFSE